MLIKKILFCSITVTFLSTFSIAQWVSVDNSSLPGSHPEVQLISNSPASAVVKIDLPGFQVNEFDYNGKIFHSINIGESGITSEAGFPELPYIAKVLALPDQGDVSVEVLQMSSVKIFDGINIPPVREGWMEGEPETPYIENSDCYNSEEVYPQNIVNIEEPAVFRDFRIARVSVFPIRYLPAKHEIEAVSSITIRVNYLGGDGINPKTTPSRPIAPSFAKLYRNFIFNYQEVLNERFSGREDGYDMMLCIMPDEFVTSFQVYADWKHKTGTFIHITKFSEIGASANNPEAVKNHILDAYTNWLNPPTHVLIVGDDGVAPVKYVSYDWTFLNEDYFVELEGDDYFPELLIGRFTNQINYTMQVMINKFIKYEKTPYTEDESWFRKGTVCSNNAYPTQVQTKRYVATLMMEGGQFTSVDTLMSDGSYSGTDCTVHLSDVLAAINNGRSFLNYRGEGWNDGWHANCYYFNTSAVSTLNNGEKLPFVTSIGCGVAMFDVNGGNCFGEQWLELGTLTEPRGAVAFLGPTSNTHTYWNDAIDRGIYEGVMFGGLDSPGEALLNGKLYMYGVFGNTYWVEYHFRIYCALGDPSLHVWKNVPNAVSVDHPLIVPVGFSQPQITVTHTGTGIPVRDAQVCISGNDVYSVGYTDNNGMVILDVNPSTEGELSIAVRGGNVIPYEGVIQVLAGTQNVAPYGDPVVTDIDGNDDGLINPNENCTMTITLKNWGTQTSSNVNATLSLPDSVDFVDIITTDPVSYGDLTPGGSFTGTPFQFYIHSECPVGYDIPFILSVTSSTNAWEYYPYQVVHGCMLEYDEYEVNDDGNPLNNYRMDPGETVKLYLKIANTGDDIATDVKGILTSDDEYITITDSVGTFGSLLPDSSIFNESDYFVVHIDESCPLQHEAEYTIRLMTENGLYPHSTTSIFTIPVALPTVLDPTGPDVYGYYAYSSDDLFWQQSPEYNWVEIETIGNEITIPNGYSDYTQTVSLPFSFKYYGLNQSQVRISTDGWIAFGSGTLTLSQNYPLPHQDAINNMVAAFWDDLFSLNAGEQGALYYYYDQTNHRFIVEWKHVGHFIDYTDVETFEIILLDPVYYPTTTGDGEIIIQYEVVEEPGSCTVGIENSTEDIGLQYLYNQIYDITAGFLQNGYAIKFTTNSPTVVSVDDEKDSEVLFPTQYSLELNYPNPFNPETRLKYSIPETGYVSLSIFRIDGQLVRTLQNGNKLAGTYEVVWDGKNDYGNKVSSGVYFYRLQAKDFSKVRKMILLK